LRKFACRRQRVDERWQADNLTDPEAFEAFKTFESDTLDVDEEAGDDSAERAEFAIYTHLAEDFNGAIESDEVAAEIADRLVSTFEENVDTSYPGWETSKSTEQVVEILILYLLPVKDDRRDLIHEALVDAVREYLINKYA